MALDRGNPDVDALLKQLVKTNDAGDLVDPIGWLFRGLTQWQSDKAGGLADLRRYARRGLLDLYYFIDKQTADAGSIERFILGYEPASVEIPASQAESVTKWYEAVGAVYGWLGIPEGDDLEIGEAGRFVDEIGDAINKLAPVLVRAQTSWERSRA